MGIGVFKSQKVNVETDKILIDAASVLEVLISGDLDGADVRTNLIDLAGNRVPIRPLSWQSSLGDTLTPPPLGDGGVIEVTTNSITFSVVNAGALTDINLEYSFKRIT